MELEASHRDHTSRASRQDTLQHHGEVSHRKISVGCSFYIVLVVRGRYLVSLASMRTTGETGMVQGRLLSLGRGGDGLSLETLGS